MSESRTPLLGRNDNNAKKILNNQRIDLAVGTVDSLAISTIFTMFLTEVMQRFLEESARFVLFPIAAASAVIRAGLAWRQAKLENGKNGSVGRAIVETIAALAVGTAVVGGLVATALFATISPIIFTATMGAKTLFHLGSASYYWGKSAKTHDSEKREQYRNAARTHLIGTVASGLVTFAVGFVMLAAKSMVAVLGISAGVVTAGLSFYNLLKSCIKKPGDEKTLRSDDIASVAPVPTTDKPSPLARFRVSPEQSEKLDDIISRKTSAKDESKEIAYFDRRKDRTTDIPQQKMQHSRSYPTLRIG